MSSIKYKGQTYSGASSIEDASHVIATDASGNLTTVQALLDAGAGIVELTQAQYDALPTATKNDGRIYAITDGTTTAIAEDVRYDNTDSGLTASNVQDAVDEITTTVSENFDDVFGDFASIEASSTASKAYAVGDYLVYDSKFYKVTSAIAQGATIVPNTNVVKTTVADEFSSASNIDYSNTTSGLTATNVQSALDETASIIQARKNVLTTGSFSKAVTMRTQTTIGNISVPSGTHLILTWMVLSNAGASAYNHTLASRVVRSTETNGGGSINFAITTSASDLGVTAYTMSIDTTVVVHYAVIKLY